MKKENVWRWEIKEQKEIAKEIKYHKYESATATMKSERYQVRLPLTSIRVWSFFFSFSVIFVVFFILLYICQFFFMFFYSFCQFSSSVHFHLQYGAEAKAK